MHHTSAPVDCATDGARQQHVFAAIGAFLDAPLRFDDKDAARRFFQRLTQATRDWNRMPPDTPPFKEQEKRLQDMLAEVTEHA